MKHRETEDGKQSGLEEKSAADGNAATAGISPEIANNSDFADFDTAYVASDVKAAAAPDLRKIAVFASGTGSNLAALTAAQREGRLGGGVIELLVSDRPEAPVAQRAEEAGIPSLLLRPKDFADRGAYEAEIVAELQRRGIGLIVLAGYMRLITPVLLEPFKDRIVNIHPSLLPAFAGKDAIGQALAYGVKLTGATVHFVDGGMDTGPVIAQRAVPVLEGDTADTLAARIHAAEHVLYPETVAALAAGRVKLNGRLVSVAAE